MLSQHLYLSLAACSNSGQDEAFETKSPDDIEFKTITEADVDVSSRLPEESAWGCESRTVRTTNGFYTLKNADVLNGDEATYYFAPYKNMNYSCSLRIQFENGTVNVRDECQMRVFGTGVLGTRYCRVPGSWYRAEGYVGPGR